MSVSISDNQRFFMDYERLLDRHDQLTNYKRSLSEIDSLYSTNIQKVVIDNLEGAAAIVFTQPDLVNQVENKFLVLKVKSGLKMEEAFSPLVEVAKEKVKRGQTKKDDLFRMDNEIISKISKISLKKP